jgi:hypothetical protein
MEETPNRRCWGELELSPDIASNPGKSHIEQLCEAVRGLSPEVKLAWYNFKTATHHEGS